MHDHPTMRDGRKSAVGKTFLVYTLAAGAIMLGGLGMTRGVQQASPSDESAAKGLSRAFRAAAEQSLPMVVRIETHSKAKSEQVQNPFKGSPLERFFNFDEDMFQFGQPQPRSGLGSGVIIDKSGIILTNNHVVADADEVTVKLADGRTFKSSDIKTDERTDLAIVRITGAGDLPQARLGNSDNLEIGDWVIAIGTPFGLDQTVSAGIISGKGRSIDDGSRTRFLQTDAAINPGNSGGPLINLDGEVVGINAAIASNSGGYQGIGFAIPINLAQWVTKQLVSTGNVQRAYLGVSIRPVTQQLVPALKLSNSLGALITEIYPDTPAAKAGFQVGDVIVEFAGRPVDSPSTLRELVERTDAGQKQEVRIIRDGKPMAVQVVVQSLPKKFGMATEPARSRRGTQGDAETNTWNDTSLGVTFSDLTPELARRAGHEGQSGVIVVEVDPEGVASDSVLRPGTLVLGVGAKRTPIASLDELKAALEKESLEKGILFLVRLPGGQQDFVVLQADK